MNGDTESLERAFAGNPNCPANTSELLDLAEDARAGDEEARALCKRLGLVLS